MNRKERIKSSTSFIMLCCTVLFVSSKMARAQAGKLSTSYDTHSFSLRQRRVSNGTYTHGNPFEASRDKLIAAYKLEEYRDHIVNEMPGLKIRKYRNYTPEENSTFVTSELFKYAFNNSLKCFDNAKKKEAVSLFRIAVCIHLDNKGAFGNKYNEPLRKLSKLFGIDYYNLSKKYN